MSQESRISQAELLAGIQNLEETGVVVEALVFGSVSLSSRRPNDLDVIVVLPEEMYQEFIRKLPTEIEDDRVGNVYGNPLVAVYRLDICRGLFRKIASGDETKTIAFSEFDDLAYWLVKGELDMFVFPPGWQHRQEEIIKDYNHPDPTFIPVLFQQATPITQVTPPPSVWKKFTSFIFSR